jgi:hypothetical protein
VYLLVFQHIPVARAAALIADLNGARPSTGWISSVLTAVADVLVDVDKLIKTLIALAHVIHLDETTSNINGARWWLHVASTQKLTAYHLHPSRGRAAVAEFAILPDYRGTVVHDALSVYAAYTGATHALCGAHLVREFTAAAEAHPDQIWPEQALRALHGLNTAAHQAATSSYRRSHPRSPNHYCTSGNTHCSSGSPNTAAFPAASNPRPATCLNDYATATNRYSCSPTTSRCPSPTTKPSRSCYGDDTWIALRDAITGNPWKPPLPA